MKCISIDDEPFALELISDYIIKTPFLEFTAGFTDPFKAMAYLTRHPVDLVFLDISMPEISGLELLNSLTSVPGIIFTTAYPDFAATSYDYNAVDYLVKPIKYDRFLKAVNKAYDHFGGRLDAGLNKNIANQEKKRIIIKSGTQFLQVPTEEILYIEASGNYMIFYTKKEKILSLISMAELIKLLPANGFIRIHKSYVISLSQIEIIEKSQVVINKKTLPIGITYREHFASILKNDIG